MILGITFKENCPHTRNSKVNDIIKRLEEYEIVPIVTDPWDDPEIAKPSTLELEKRLWGKYQHKGINFGSTPKVLPLRMDAT